MSIVYSIFIKQEPAGVSCTVTISDQRSYIKIETLPGKNPSEIHGAITEICGEFTVEHHSIFFRWVKHFRCGCVGLDNDRGSREDYGYRKKRKKIDI